MAVFKSSTTISRTLGGAAEAPWARPVIRQSTANTNTRGIEAGFTPMELDEDSPEVDVGSVARGLAAPGAPHTLGLIESRRPAQLLRHRGVRQPEQGGGAAECFAVDAHAADARA